VRAGDETVGVVGVDLLVLDVEREVAGERLVDDARDAEREVTRAERAVLGGADRAEGVDDEELRALAERGRAPRVRGGLAGVPVRDEQRARRRTFGLLALGRVGLRRGPTSQRS
jgi:hypothetical protein